MCKKLVIDGRPIPKKRPRFSKGRVYDEQSKEKKNIRCILMQQMSEKGILTRYRGPIAVNMTFHTQIPKKTSQKALKSILGKPDPRRPDLDNYVKMYADCMNELLYDDDSEITELWCEKLYSNKPRVEITINELRRK